MVEQTTYYYDQVKGSAVLLSPCRSRGLEVST